ncbi:MAG: ATP synthase F1 subunit delta [Nitrospirota bacterium]|nr:ATP synthase F1 subunit delta [Nitrospirota bacterium]
MKPVKEAKKYAKMFIGIVGIEEAPKALAELSLVDALMAKSKEFRSLLVNPGFSAAEKENGLKQVAARLSLSDKMLRFVSHLTQTGVITALSDVIKAATVLYMEKKKKAKATVLTPVEISAKHEERLKASLKKLIEKDVDIEFVMDPSLLGGILVKVGSTMYDSSLKGQLRLLKDELIKG